MDHEPFVIEGDCERMIEKLPQNLLPLHFTFLDPPFNQNKEYDNYDDNLPQNEYWKWITRVCKKIHDLTEEGGAIYFMQREKNVFFVLEALSASGWVLQSLIVWKKKTSAVPQVIRFGKQYQIIAFATKGIKPRLFNRLRVDLPLEFSQKIPRENGVYVNDVWDDILELTSGFFAGDEVLRDDVTNKRSHEQQSPIALLLRIILSSTKIGDHVFDPFAGTGTCGIVTSQLKRYCVEIEKSKKNCELIHERLNEHRKIDDIIKYYDYYRYTDDIEILWECSKPRKRWLSLLSI